MSMTSTRGIRLNLKHVALCSLFVVAGSQAALAQGFGPDPFKPYNSQYDMYTYPLGLNGPEAGINAAIMQQGVRGANQFENYLREVQGLGRSGTERYGQGLPYYRSAVDPRFDRDQDRDYRPNRKTSQSFEDTQQRLTDKYLAYFKEADPKKRAQLLREYQKARRQSSRALTARRESPARLAEAGERAEASDRDRSTATDRNSGGARNTTRSAAPKARSGDTTLPSDSRSTLPPAPRRSGRMRSGLEPVSPSAPSDVLDRAHGLEETTGTSRARRTTPSSRIRSSRLPSDRSSDE